MSPAIDPSEMGLDDAQEPKVVKGGEEYKLCIIGCKGNTDKNGLAYFLPRVEIVGEPYSKDFTYFLHVPDAENMGAKQLNRVKWNWVQFCTCFGIPLDRPTNPEDDWAGREGWAIVGQSESDEFGEQNFISKLLSPK